MPEFKTVTVKELNGIFGDPNALEATLNKWSSEGWNVVSINTTPLTYSWSGRGNKGRLHTIILSKN